MILIDGSYHEGGGQIIRTSIALSALTGKSVKIENIRSSRPNPGLQAQHIAAVGAVAELCNAEVHGLSIGSKTLEFIPKKISDGELSVKISTAGSIGLVLQALLIPAAAMDRALHITIEGGATFGKWAPPVIYLEKVISPILELTGYSFQIKIKRNGFYPEGGAYVEVRTNPEGLSKFNLLSRGKIHKICGISIASKHLESAKVAERQRDAALNALVEYKNIAEIKTEYVEALCPGSGIVLWAECENSYLGADSVGERGKRAELVGEDAAKKLLKQIDSKAGIDEWMADQIIPYLAIAGGSVNVAKITSHARTNIWVVEKFFDARFEVNDSERIISFKKS